MHEILLENNQVAKEETAVKSPEISAFFHKTRTSMLYLSIY